MSLLVVSVVVIVVCAALFSWYANTHSEQNHLPGQQQLEGSRRDGGGESATLTGAGGSAHAKERPAGRGQDARGLLERVFLVELLFNDHCPH